MNCPVCKQITLVQREMEAGLAARECNVCGGQWIGSWQYWKWKEHTGNDLPAAEAAPDSADPSVRDREGVKLCPECGHFLRRYPVGEGLRFSLDRCGHCGGMWFDRNEWEVLRRHGLGEVHKIFSEIWQHRIRDEEQAQARERLYREMFGEEDYRRICEMREWIEGHPHKAELRAFLRL